MIKRKILHITAHIGGGVGTVLLGYLRFKNDDEAQEHIVLSLDKINPVAIAILNKLNIKYLDNLRNSFDKINSAIEKCDVVLLHWWNHPLISNLLVNHKLPECRLLLWSHISGFAPPNNFTKKIFKYPDLFIFTTPLSYFTPEYVDLSLYEQEKVSAIWSTAGVERLEGISSKEHVKKGFNVGYVGSLDFSKIHPNILEICGVIDIPNINFIFVGPINQFIVDAANKLNLSDRIRFTGYISEAEKWQELNAFDVFGYPLAPHHYGTCDQVLQEAMALGVPPVVLNNPMESYMVTHNRNGLVAESISEYIQAIHSIYNNKDLRKKLSSNAREFAKNEYSIVNMCNQWDELFEKAIKIKKNKKNWPSIGNGENIKTEPYKAFTESLGLHAGIFNEYFSPKKLKREVIQEQLRRLGSSHNWKSDNKSTVHQFSSFFPDDPMLSELSFLMRNKYDYEKNK